MGFLTSLWRWAKARQENCEEHRLLRGGGEGGGGCRAAEGPCVGGWSRPGRGTGNAHPGGLAGSFHSDQQGEGGTVPHEAG